MPLVEILHRSTVTRDQLIQVRDALQRDVALVVGRFDPDHEMTPAMVDVRAIATGPIDTLRPDVLITVLAREEPARNLHKMAIVAALTDTVSSILPTADAVVELVLTNRVSIYEYPT